MVELNISEYNVGDVWKLLVLLVAVCIAIVAVWNAIKAAREMRKPFDSMKEEIHAMDVRITKLEARSDTLGEALSSVVENEKMLLRAINALVSHQIDGNGFDKLMLVKADIDSYLTNKL